MTNSSAIVRRVQEEFEDTNQNP